MNGSDKTGKYGVAACLAIAIIVLAAALSQCAGSSSRADAVFPADQCVFIDHHVHKDGVLLEGEGRRMMIDFPTYSFSPEDRKLRGMVNFAVNDSLLVVYGDGNSLGGAMGGGAATWLSGVYALPYTQRDLTISSVRSNGTVTIAYKDETIVLAPGESWDRTTSEVQTTDGYGGNRSRINVTTTDRIVNNGLLNKKDIVNNKGW